MSHSKRIHESIAAAAFAVFGTVLLTPSAVALEVTVNPEHILTTVAEGVYVLRHKRAAEIGALSGNTTLVVGQREALVVDSALLPSIARVDLGGRKVRLLHLGRGNTSGDGVVWLPAERIVVTGDLVVYPRPFLIGGFPTEWVRTLDAVGALAPRTVVPGHGAVLDGGAAQDYLRLVTDLLATVSRLVQEETFRLGNRPGQLEEVQAAVLARPEIATLRERFASPDDQDGESFLHSLGGLVAASYREAWGT